MRTSTQIKQVTFLEKSLQLWGLSLGLILSASLLSNAWANPSIDINVIEASHKAEHFSSPQLKKLDRSLKASFKKFNHFELVQHFHVELPNNSAQELKISASLKMNLLLKKMIKQGLRLQVNFSHKARKHTINAKFEKLFYEALIWKGKTYIISFEPHR